MDQFVDLIRELGQEIVLFNVVYPGVAWKKVLLKLVRAQSHGEVATPCGSSLRQYEVPGSLAQSDTAGGERGWGGASRLLWSLPGPQALV